MWGGGWGKLSWVHLFLITHFDITRIIYRHRQCAIVLDSSTNNYIIFYLIQLLALREYI